MLFAFPLFFLLSLTGVIATYHSEVLAKTYQTPAEFISHAFSGNPPPPKILWIKKSLREQAEKILSHKTAFMRVRYRKQAGKSLWILEEIGKTKPITVGIVINLGKIITVKVLAFQESRGWEVKHDFFTDQFTNAQLKSDLYLNQNIDGISGATLSVRAVTKLARLALLFERSIRQ